MSNVDERIGQLVLPSDNVDEWTFVEQVLNTPMDSLSDLDNVLTRFGSLDREPRVCTFFSTIPGSRDAGNFDFERFWRAGVPLLLDVALDMPNLFKDTPLPIFKMRSTWADPQVLTSKRISLSRRQCACLLAHSFFGSLKRPANVQLNDFRFTVVDLFMGTAVSPNSACTFLNYWSCVGTHGFPDGPLTYERRGYRKGAPPWDWATSERPLCSVELRDGTLDVCEAPVHAEFANAFVGGGVMTGDAAMEELLFLVKPELMVAMALMERMVDEEVVLVAGAHKYSRVSGYGQHFDFGGDYADERPPPAPTVCAIDAVRGGGPAMTQPALLRDMNKARVAFEGASEVATGHWGCGAYGNNHDLMFLKQWLAASDAGASKMYYHDFSRRQSHHIFPLIRRLKHMNVGQLWAFLNEITGDLRKPHNMSEFCSRIANIATGKLKVPK